ncbi:hypothetical protein HEK616_82470 (plasmid) [Streptomyces nigrescens]|uniref:Uncharacterized protein n=1 Tax=Streptomyces nigrescens TaxID=1920 RepID=A0ABM8A8A8_STRNI|nr:hypothetical protein HEK616_82470 [Streptomyces nigrescens]
MGAFLALGGEHVGVAGVGVAPAEIGVQGPGLRGWLRWWELARVNCRSGPKWASIGLAQEA